MRRKAEEVQDWTGLAYLMGGCITDGVDPELAQVESHNTDGYVFYQTFQTPSN